MPCHARDRQKMRHNNKTFSSNLSQFYVLRSYEYLYANLRMPNGFGYLWIELLDLLALMMNGQSDKTAVRFFSTARKRTDLFVIVNLLCVCDSSRQKRGKHCRKNCFFFLVFFGWSLSSAFYYISVCTSRTLSILSCNIIHNGWIFQCRFAGINQFWNHLLFFFVFLFTNQ